ncbi:MAG: class I SAM-dependent methyltransferase [Thermogemmatispora sp.]|jgi:SAM-dependent methyltransferase|uniref:class I SAM-dependent methyltransferase n=1 Tax=Thermogemmatispora sp. TaxID=1968838 RepID=UPI0019E336A9|nr:class I SAM-dependent methyltransferase [Thermogemmatispora sp.]MBE3568195.1 class I SAM-dependent methyltransferase [Thermogemmatispora sp.]
MPWWRARRSEADLPSASPAADREMAPVAVDAAGRRRREDIPYLLPKDQEERNRLDYQHYVLRQVFRGNILAPVAELLREGIPVLDVGTGTARWAIEVAEAFPRCQVTGFDREPPRSSQNLPPTYRFVQGDLLQGLPFPDHAFGYVHQRLLVAGIPLLQWPAVIQELVRVTRHGGWIEMVELGLGLWPQGPCLQQVVAWWQQLSAARGMDASQLFLLGRWLREAGTVQVEQRTLWLPVGRWGGRLGQLLAQDLLAAARTLEAPVEGLGVSATRFHEVLEGLAREWQEGQVTYEVYATWGRKP